MSHRSSYIDAGFGRYDDMALHHPLLDHIQLDESRDEGDDFWEDDPHYPQICSEREDELERIRDAPLRHHKKR